MLLRQHSPFCSSSSNANLHRQTCRVHQTTVPFNYSASASQHTSRQLLCSAAGVTRTASNRHAVLASSSSSRVCARNSSSSSGSSSSSSGLWRPAAAPRGGFEGTHRLLSSERAPALLDPPDPTSTESTNGADPYHSSVCSGFSSFVSSLRPTAEHRQVVNAAAAAFRNAAITTARADEHGDGWWLNAVHTVGSWSRDVALKHSDLDLLVEMDVGEDSQLRNFPQYRRDCLTGILEALCRPLDTSRECSSPAATVWQLARSGWKRVKDKQDWVRFYHPVLALHVDVRICLAPPKYLLPTWLNDSKQQLLDLLVGRCITDYQDDSEEEEGALLGEELGVYFGELTDYSNKRSDVVAQRAALLTPLLSGLVAKTESKYDLPHGLISDVILANKVWVRYGIADELSEAASGSDDIMWAAAAVAAAARHPVRQWRFMVDNGDVSHEPPLQIDSGTAKMLHKRHTAPEKPEHELKVESQPPGLALEMPVLCTIERKFREGGHAALEPYRRPGSGQLILFMDSLHTMSVHFAAGLPPKPSACDGSESCEDDFDFYRSKLYLTSFYTEDELRLLALNFVWDVQVPHADSPLILHPADPTYNCAGHTGFREWKAMAEQARILLIDLSAILANSLSLAFNQPGPVDYSISGTANRVPSFEQHAREKYYQLAEECQDSWMLVRNHTSLGVAIQKLERDPAEGVV